jgi:hypothetical protein
VSKPAKGLHAETDQQHPCNGLCKIKEKATEQTFTLFSVFCQVTPHHLQVVIHLTVRPHWINFFSFLVLFLFD